VKTINVLFIGADPAVGAELLRELDLGPASALPTPPEILVLLRAQAGDPSADAAAWREAIGGADIMGFYANHLDALSVQTLQQIYELCRGKKTAPLHMLLCRSGTAGDFKISCPHCGQKMWVREADADKRGRCPTCQKGFPVPHAVKELKQRLGLPDIAPVTPVTLGHPVAAHAALMAILRPVVGPLLDARGLLISEAMQKHVLHFQVVR
jgi:hypothetical protein